LEDKLQQELAPKLDIYLYNEQSHCDRA
jgi:hypothetical protein